MAEKRLVRAREIALLATQLEESANEWFERYERLETAAKQALAVRSQPFAHPRAFDDLEAALFRDTEGDR